MCFYYRIGQAFISPYIPKSDFRLECVEIHESRPHLYGGRQNILGELYVAVIVLKYSNFRHSPRQVCPTQLNWLADSENPCLVHEPGTHHTSVLHKYSTSGGSGSSSSSSSVVVAVTAAAAADISDNVYSVVIMTELLRSE